MELKFQSPYWDKVSEDAIDLIKKMLDRDQEKRIKAEDVLKHKWIQSNQELLVKTRTNYEASISSKLIIGKEEKSPRNKSPKTKSPRMKSPYSVSSRLSKKT
jgi:serine/threonine protein kinase